MDDALLMLVFNRPGPTRRVFEEVRKRRPTRLYVAADGPREGREDDVQACTAVREIFDEIDWPCELSTRFRDVNLGCGPGVAEAVTWFFECEKRGIILEDDCLPAPDFFPYCSEMLERYQGVDEVMHVNGNSFGAPSRMFRGHSIGYSSFPQVWGWASWAEAWKGYQFEVPEREVDDLDVPPGIPEALWSRFVRRFRDITNTWDFQWQFAVMRRGGLCTCPSSNLIANIGFGEGATHTLRSGSPKAGLQTGRLELPLRLPDELVPDPALNAHYARWMTEEGGTRQRVRSLLRRLLGRTG